MSNYVVSARKYRPQKFSEVVGQSHVTGTLKNALKTGQLAQALLFCGPRGVGKTTCARILAKVVNCDNPEPGFDSCIDAQQQNQQENVSSFSIFELDAASNNSVEGIRNLIEQVRFVPPKDKKKIYIIDEVHMLSTAAFNAFLKTLEEPPPYAIFILATTEKHKILPTILSRCQIYDFSRISVDDIAGHLIEISKKEKIEAEAEALHLIAQKADGALRDALSMFDRLASAEQGKITYQNTLNNLNILDYGYYFNIVDAFLSEDLALVLNKYNEIEQKGFDGDLFINGLANHFRNLLVAKDETTVELLQASKVIEQKYLNQAKITPASFILNALNVCNSADINYKMAKNKRLHIEMALIRLNYLNSQIEIATNNENLVKKKPEQRVESSKQEVETKVSPPDIQGMKHGVDNLQKSEEKANQQPIEDIQEVDNQPQESVKVVETKPQKEENKTSKEVTEKQLETKQGENILQKVDKIIDEGQPNSSVTQTSKPNYKILNTSSNAVLLSPNLLDRLEEKYEIVEETNENLPEDIAGNEETKLKTAVSSEAVQNCLTTYAQMLKKQSKNVLGNLIGNLDFTIDGPTIIMGVDSKVKQQQLLSVKENLLIHLKEQLQQKEVQLKISFIERTESSQIPTQAYTQKERLNEMMQENPDIKDLIEKLDLKFD